jgi:hypothetical protein
MSWYRTLSVLVLWSSTSACEQDDDAQSTDSVQTEPGPTMRPGDNCLRCHNPLGQAARRPWSAAGTVFPTLDAERTEGVPGVTVSIEDAEGQLVVTLVTNEAGNFYTDAALPDPFFVSLENEGERIAMPCAPPAGSCNACHSPNPVGYAPGRIYVPGAHPDAGAFDCEDWEAGGPGRAGIDPP